MYHFDAASLHFEPIQTVAATPDSYPGQKWSADIHVSSDGKFLYASNRAHNTIVKFTIDGVTGKLSSPDWVSSGGEIPRNFAFDITGDYVLAANQDSGMIIPFKVDAATGKLTQTGQGVGRAIPGVRAACANLNAAADTY